MAIPLLHHGMLYVGIPYSESALSSTTTGGSLYGATHVTWNRSPDSLSDDEKSIAVALGKRVAEIASKLAA
jgi:NAD(P)H dehydrogenase (quinone)